MSAPQSQPSDGIAAALENFAEAPRPAGRAFSVRDTAIVLVVACVFAVLFDSEGLLGWARRLEVGRTQAVLVHTLASLHETLSGVRLDLPRQWSSRAREQLAKRVGGDGDPLLAKGWVPPIARVVAPVMVLSMTLPPEESPEPEMPAVVEQPAPGDGILLIGDSMIGGSLGATLERTLAMSSGLPVRRAAQLGTGLARPDIFDWMQVVPALIEREHPRFVVISLGANDATNLLEGDEQIDYGTARWRQVYSARVEAMMRALAGEHTRVLWLTLPPMRDRRLSARATYLNGVFAQCARKVPRVEFLEVDLLIGDPQRQFATFVQAPDGRLLRYRLDDGVHLAPAGSRAVAVWVRDWVRERAGTH